MITFELDGEQRVKVMQDGKEVGHIFSPSDSANSNENAIQICGFSEAFDLWGCGVYKGFKDIQLLFDGKSMDGIDVLEKGYFLPEDCCVCYRTPCQCDDGKALTVKRERDIKDRIVKVKRSDPEV